MVRCEGAGWRVDASVDATLGVVRVTILCRQFGWIECTCRLVCIGNAPFPC